MTETDKNTLPQELKEWIEKEAKEYAPPREDGSYKMNSISHIENVSFTDGATALYAHLKPLIDDKEKDEEIAKLKK